ncbi:MAG: hypothetical protein WD607_01245 [Candidatus Paceibacterota bacterium]
MDTKKLILKINSVYNILNKIPLSLDFYEKYHEYKILALKIEKLLEIDKKSIVDEKQDSIKSFMLDTLYGYTHFKIFPLLNFIEENKGTLFTKFPDENVFNQVKYHFLKLGKTEGDERYEYWLSKTNEIFNNFLENIKTTKKGNDLFIKTNIMNAIPEINDLYTHIKKDNNSKKSYLERIDENDTFGLIIKIKELEMDKKMNFTISLRDKGKTDYIGFYDKNKLTKEEMLEPIHIFQSLIDSSLKDKDKIIEQQKIVSFDSESSKILCNGKEVKITKGKDIYYAIKYLFERKDIYDECFYDEIRDESELNDGKERTDKNIYDALMQFNKRLINKGIDDLFIINFHSIKIRNKHKIVTL